MLRACGRVRVGVHLSPKHPFFPAVPPSPPSPPHPLFLQLPGNFCNLQPTRRCSGIGDPALQGHRSRMGAACNGAGAGGGVKLRRGGVETVYGGVGAGAG